MIEIKQVSKSFDRSQAVEQASLSVRKASIYGLLGSNGAGKTTILKMLAGIYKQDTGTIEIDGQSVFENVAIKARIIFISDYPFFLSQYTIQQMAEYYQSLYPNWDEQRFSQLGKIFQIDRKKKIHRLSKGMQRQVAFWLAFSAKPDVLLLDEPMDGLDPIIRKQVRQLLISEVAERKMTILISSHNLKEVEDICDSIAILHQGKILFEKEIDAVKTDIHKVQIAFKNDVPEDLFGALTIYQYEKRGSVQIAIVKGKKAEITSQLQKYLPVVLDILPLTLEEVFVHELEAVGYEIKNIID